MIKNIDELNDVFNAVRQVTDRFGTDIIKDCRRFCSALSDFAPKLKSENKAFSIALSENVGEIYIRDNEAVLSGQKQAADVIKHAEAIIGEYLNREKAEMVALSLAYALGWDINSDEAAELLSSEDTSETLVEELIRQTENGNSEACFNLGECYFYGRGGAKQDYARAIKWYAKSAETGECSSQKKLAECYRSGLGTSCDYSKAVYWYTKAAEQGDYDSRHALVLCYLSGGEKLPPDKEKAEQLAYLYDIELDEENYNIARLMRGADSGSPGMQYNLGNAYFNGTGIPADREKAVYWYEKAAQQNYAPALFNLACCCATGTGTEKDTSKAVRLYRKAADAGELDAMNNLAAMYFKGEGVLKDYKKASDLWYKAAKSGNARAQYNFGECKFNAWGVSKNESEAAYWYKKAAEQLDSDAQYSLGWCFFTGSGVMKDYNQAKRFFEASAVQMNINAQIQLAYCYMNGFGTERNFSKAAEWFSKAAARGNKDAAKMYVHCLKYGGYYLVANETRARRAAKEYGVDYDEA